MKKTRSAVQDTVQTQGVSAPVVAGKTGEVAVFQAAQKASAAWGRETVVAHHSQIGGLYGTGVSVASGRDPQMSAQVFARRWAAVKPEDTFKVARRVSVENASIRSYLALRRAMGAAGFALAGEEGRSWLRGLRASGFPVDALVSDVWKEWTTTQNVLVWWSVGQTGESGLPVVWVHPAEDIVEYRDGPEAMVKVRTTKAQRSAMGKAEAGVPKKKWEEKPDCTTIELTAPAYGWEMLNTAKTGEGLAVPDLYSIFFDLSIADLLQTGDWNGAWLMRNIIEHVKKGHEISAGPMAGQNRYHLRKKDRDALDEALEKVRGVMRLITNFDVTREYNTFPAEFFTAEKWESLKRRLDEWGGPLLMLLRNEGRVLPAHLYDLARARGEEERGEVGGLLARVLRRVTAEAGRTMAVGAGPVAQRPPDGAIRVTWNPLTWILGRERQGMLSFLLSNGLLSAESMREYLGIDHGLESARMKAAWKDAEAFIPVHVPHGTGEPASGAGRPAEAGAFADDMAGE